MNRNTYIIYLYPFFFRKYHWDRYEFNYLKKYFYVEVHELYKFQYPHIQKFKRNSYKEDKYVKNFTSYNINTKKESYLNFITNLSSNNPFRLSNTYMHGIDIGKLIFEPDSTIQIENKLSNILQRKIILDKQKLNYYREKSLEQLQFWEEKGIMIYE